MLLYAWRYTMHFILLLTWILLNNKCCWVCMWETHVWFLFFFFFFWIFLSCMWKTCIYTTKIVKGSSQVTQTNDHRVGKSVWMSLLLLIYVIYVFRTFLFCFGFADDKIFSFSFLFLIKKQKKKFNFFFIFSFSFLFLLCEYTNFSLDMRSTRVKLSKLGK